MKLKFGTGGLRAIMGPADDQMNFTNIQKATLGVAHYAKSIKEKPVIAIAHDSRNNSREFAQHTARVLAGEGCTAYLYPRLMPTPALSFAVRHLACDLGICITASHNSKEYNGYKVYGSDGCQITSKGAKEIKNSIEIMEERETREPESLDYYLNQETVKYIPEETVQAFLAAVLESRITKNPCSDLKVVYTPLHGAGRECVEAALKKIGVTELILVEEQALPDGNFPTCSYPNPEDPKAMELGIAWCEKTDADILIATDPDCDRIGVAAKRGDVYKQLDGNQVGILLLDFVLKQKKTQGTMPENPVFIKTIVTTSLAEEIAKRNGVQVIQTLTGYKYIGEQIGLLEEKGELNRYLFSFEESCGYLPGAYVRDKDGVGAAMLVCEMAEEYKRKGKTLWDVLLEIYQEYGRSEGGNSSYTLHEKQAAQWMERLRKDLSSEEGWKMDGVKAVRYVDFLVETDGLPKADVLKLWLEDGTQVIVRPSGTEPKIKFYIEKQ